MFRFIQFGTFFLLILLERLSLLKYESVVNAICLILIILFGIPHGAVDHKIHLSTSTDTKVWKYILRYLLIAAGYVVWWLIDPLKALLIFILLSAYHFGQELLEDKGIKSSNLTTKLVWGAILIIAPLIYRYTEVTPYLEAITNNQFPSISIWVQYGSPIFLMSCGIANALWLVSVKKVQKKEAMSLIIFMIIMVTSYVMLPFLLAFASYFILFHSLNAFKHQFSWLSKKNRDYTLRKFAFDLAGFSVVSIVGILIVLKAINPKDLTQLTSYFFILTSLITLPHAITFDQFYRTKNKHQTVPSKT